MQKEALDDIELSLLIFIELKNLELLGIILFDW